MNLIVAPTTVVCALFQGDKTFVGNLGELGVWAKENNAGVLKSCHIDDERYGLFPCLIATCPRATSALSVYSGYEVAMGDGRSFFTRKDAIECYLALKRAGVPVTPECLVWAVSELPYSAPTKPEAPKSQQPSVEAQLADSPF